MYRFETVWVPKYSDCDKQVLDVGARAMPGKVVCLQDRQPESAIAIPDKDYIQPDTSLVVSSGVECLPVGTTVVSKPSYQDDPVGAYYKEVEGRWVRIFGIPYRWNRQLMATLSENGLSPLPGWAIWQLEWEHSYIGPSRRTPKPYAKCLVSCGDGFSDPLGGETTILPDEFYRIHGHGEDLVIGEVETASKGFALEQFCTTT